MKDAAAISVLVEEVWKPVPSVDGLLASSIGRVKIAPFRVMTRRGHLSKLYGGTPTYGNFIKNSGKAGRMIFVWKRNRTDRKNYTVAQLVCEAFHGPKPFLKAVCMHLDENPLNNRADNLQWGTQKENMNAPGFLNYCKQREQLKAQRA